MKNHDAHLVQTLAAATAVATALTSFAANAACTAGTLDTAFGAAGTGGYVQAGPVLLNGTTGDVSGALLSPDNGFVLNIAAGMDSSSNTILGIAKFKHGGTLDTTYGGFGVASPGGFTPYASGPESAMTQDSAGNVIDVRLDGAGITVTRFTAAGNLDLSYGSSGSTSVALANLTGFAPIDATALADGSVLVTSGAKNPSASNSSQPFVAKFTPSGALDATFGSGGISYFYSPAVTDPSSWGVGTGIATLPSGKIVLVGRFQPAAGHRVTYVAQLLADGSLDATFGTGGLTLVDMSPAYPFAQGRKIVVQPDGKLVVAGNGNDALGNFVAMLFRFLPTGSLDAGFGSGGKTVLTTAFGLIGYTVALQNNGKILVGSAIQTDVAGDNFTGAVIRFTSAGTLDTAFGSGGFAMVLPAGWSYDSVGDVLYLSGGKIVARAQAGQGSLVADFIVRLDSGSGSGCH